MKRTWCLLLFVVSACHSQPGDSVRHEQARDSIARDQAETQALLEAMAKHPSLANGPTRVGPDTALLPPPRGPSTSHAMGAAHHHP